MKGLSFYINQEHYAVDVTLVQKVARKLTVCHVPAAPDEVIGITNVNGKAVTVLSISKLVYGKRISAPVPGSQILNAVIFKPQSNDSDRMGFAIERLGDLIELDLEKASPQNLKHITGIAESNGVLYRIVDIASVIDRFNEGNRY